MANYARIKGDYTNIEGQRKVVEKARGRKIMLCENDQGVYVPGKIDDIDKDFYFFVKEPKNGNGSVSIRLPMSRLSDILIESDLNGA